ncbi:MAG: signal peptidase II [Chloroflexi bacterium]|nr:signal peptidase II [Chloroflexota bacterium]
MAARFAHFEVSRYFGRGVLLLLATAAAIVLLDQWSKGLAVQNLRDETGASRSVPLPGNVVYLTYVENFGAAFGLFQNQTGFFVVVGFVVIAVIVSSYRHVKDAGWLLNFCLGLQLGGAVGNMVDRLRTGYVVDFIDLRWWPVFNIADSAITVGVILLAYNLLFPRAHEPSTAT